MTQTIALRLIEQAKLLAQADGGRWRRTCTAARPAQLSCAFDGR